MKILSKIALHFRFGSGSIQPPAGFVDSIPNEEITTEFRRTVHPYPEEAQTLGRSAKQLRSLR